MTLLQAEIVVAAIENTGAFRPTPCRAQAVVAEGAGARARGRSYHVIVEGGGSCRLLVTFKEGLAYAASLCDRGDMTLLQAQTVVAAIEETAAFRRAPCRAQAVVAEGARAPGRERSYHVIVEGGRTRRRLVTFKDGLAYAASLCDRG